MDIELHSGYHFMLPQRYPKLYSLWREGGNGQGEMGSVCTQNRVTFESRNKYMSQLTESDCVVTAIAEVDIGSAEDLK